MQSEQVQKRKNEDEEIDEELESDSDDESSDESIDETIENVEAEFEAYPPLPTDREGMIALLKQLFKKEPVELGLLADHLIKEKNLCTVVKQMVDEVVDEEDEDVFSLSAFIQLDKLADKPFIKLIHKYLIRTAKERGCKQIVQLLENVNQSKVLVLNERLINLPAKLGIASLENLIDEANKQHLQIDYYLFICKILKSKDESSVKKDHKRSKSTDEIDLIYLNTEDELLADCALEKYEFKIVDDNSDVTIQQNWKSGQQFIPHRKVLLLDQTGLNNALKRYKETNNQFI